MEKHLSPLKTVAYIYAPPEDTASKRGAEPRLGRDAFVLLTLAQLLRPFTLETMKNAVRELNDVNRETVVDPGSVERLCAAIKEYKAYNGYTSNAEAAEKLYQRICSDNVDKVLLKVDKYREKHKI